MPKNKDFPIVGIGASAGGLEAYKRLLQALPTNTGAAYILIQHLDPNHESMMADLLARQTKMAVLQAEHEMTLSPNTVYVIPPGKFIRLIDQGLFLDEPVTEKGIRMSIDYFFRSLADEQGEKAIGIVLSGTGSDGTQGIREIKAAGGMVMVQDPEEADYNGMPRNAVDTGIVDFILPLDMMPQRLVQFMRHPYLRKAQAKEGALAEQAPGGYLKVLRLLQEQTNYDFRSYKKGTVERRIQRRMGLGQFKALADYVDHLRETPEEVHQLFRDLLIGVTRFFREPEVWESLADNVIEPMLDQKKKGEPIRIWVPGCATGEEAYTVGIVLFERMDRRRAGCPVQVFATDLNARAIDIARAGRYSAAALPDIPERLQRRFFTEEEDTILVNKRLRETVVFATQNVISDPPFSKLDIITCRNLMIYLESDVQRRMIEMFHFALAEGGHLVLGNSESAERPGRLFTSVDKAGRIYRKSIHTRPRPGSFPIVPGSKREDPKADDKEVALMTATEVTRQHLMDRFVPACVVVDSVLKVSYFHGPVRNYLDFPTGEPTRQLPDITLPDLRSKLRSVLNAVISGRQTSAKALALNVRRDEKEVTVRITAERLPGPEDPGNILVHFQDESEPRDADAEKAAREKAREAASPAERDAVASLEYELHSTREDLQSTIEEMETSNEELKASNEEVMSMNEELQSTNEELETSREELQSLNEELSTVNSQLEDKIDELERTNNDLTNLLVSIDIGVIFLDTELLIRRFTPAMKAVMRIIDGDIGRPVEDIAMRVEDPALIEDARRCLDTLTEIDAEITTDSGQHRIRRLRPYRTSENRIEGVVVSYADVTNLQNARAAARRREAQQEAVAELGRAALSGGALQEIFDASVAELSRHMGARFTKVLQLDPDGRTLTLRAGVGWTDATVGQSRVSTGIESQAGYTMEQRHAVVVRDFRDEKRFSAPPILKNHHILCGASVVIGPTDAPWGVLGVHESDLTRCSFDADDINFLQSTAHVLWLVIARDQAVKDIDAERRQLRELTESLPILFAIVDKEQRYEFVNSAYKRWVQPTERVDGNRMSDLLGPDAYAVAAPHISGVLAGHEQNFEVAVTLPGGNTRHSLVSYAPRYDDDGAVSGFFSAWIDVTERKRLERDLAERFDQYRTLGESIPFGVWITDQAGKLTYVSQAFLDLVGKTLEDARKDGLMDCIAPGMQEETAQLWQETVQSGKPWEQEVRIVGRDRKAYHVLTMGRPIRNQDEEITSWVGLNLDITARKAEAERLKVISAELDHRVKNILATVATIARMTGRTSTSVQEYRDALQARLRALAAAHRMLSEANWHGMSLERLIDVEIAPYRESRGEAIHVQGPEVSLPPSLTQTLSLAFHELTTNSGKYGALAHEDGQLDIRWTQDNDGLRISWQETGLTNVTPPTTTGFGTTLLTRILEAQGADVTMDYPSTGIRVTVNLPELGDPLSQETPS